MERTIFPYSISVSISTCLLLSPSTCPRTVTLLPPSLPRGSLNSFTGASSVVRRSGRTRVKAKVFIVSQHGVVRRVCPRSPCRSCRFSAISTAYRMHGIASISKIMPVMPRCLPQKIGTFRDNIAEAKKF